jgi:hypothetical protein
VLGDARHADRGEAVPSEKLLRRDQDALPRGVGLFLSLGRRVSARSADGYLAMAPSDCFARDQVRVGR